MSSEPPAIDTIAARVGRLGMAALQRAWTAARKRLGDLGLALEIYANDVWTLVRTRREQRGHEHDDAACGAIVPGLALEDLYLARGCEHGSERGWTHLDNEYRSRLTGLALRRGAKGVDPEDVTSGLLADLALPPTRGGARTRLGTFGGVGSLWAWLAVALVRRLQRETQKRRAATGDLFEGDLGVPAEGEASTDDAESAAALEAALRQGWAALAPEERCAIVWKHRDGLKQRRIGALLGAAEYQVSRWITRGIGKLREAVGRDLEAEPAPEPGAARHALFGAAVARLLASSGVEEVHPSEARP